MVSQHSAKGFSLISISNGVNYLSDPPPEPVSCHQSERCAGCPYPGHGFICWHGDGTCMRTDAENANAGRTSK